MSSATIAARSAADVAQAAAEQRGWLDSLKKEAFTFLRGDNNAPWAILAETVIGCVPVLGQLVDARDIIKGLAEVSGAPASPLAWFNLITALIGLVPGGGDAAKRSLRAVKSGTASIDDLLAMIRRFYSGDPEKLLREVLDLGKLRGKLDEILTNPNLTRHLSDEVKKTVETIRQGLAKQFDAFKREVDDWLAQGRKTSAEAPGAKPAPGAPQAKPGTQAREGARTRAEHADAAHANQPNAATQRTARFKRIGQKVLGILGEHMADYHCQHVKGWGQAVRHDQGLKNTAKLNDRSHLVQLWPTLLRGRGIDAVWKCGGAKPYAVIEAKASYDPTKSLNALLGEAGDKTERSGANDGTLRRRTGTGGQGGSGKTATRQTNGMVTQMSKVWVENRLESAVHSRSLAIDIKRDGYSRHVLFFSIPHAVAHAEALILHTAQRPVNVDMHAAHELTREWGDSAIDKVADSRGELKGGARDRRTR